MYLTAREAGCGRGKTAHSPQAVSCRWQAVPYMTRYTHGANTGENRPKKLSIGVGYVPVCLRGPEKVLVKLHTSTCNCEWVKCCKWGPPVTPREHGMGGGVSQAATRAICTTSTNFIICPSIMPFYVIVILKVIHRHASCLMSCHYHTNATCHVTRLGHIFE